MQTRPATNAAYWQIVAARPPTSDPMPPLASSAGENEREPTEILIPAHVDPGRPDHLGRGLDSGSVDPTVAADHAVQREPLLDYLRGAYRHPHTAKAQLDEMVKCQGWTSTVARIAQDSVRLGEFRGKVGFFARAKAKAERANAEQVAGAVAPSVAPIGTAQIGAAQTYRASVEAQRSAPATRIPKLSKRAQAAIATPAVATDEKAQAALWRGMTTDKAIGVEQQRFRGMSSTISGVPLIRMVSCSTSWFRPGAVPTRRSVSSSGF